VDPGYLVAASIMLVIEATKGWQLGLRNQGFFEHKQGCDPSLKRHASRPAPLAGREPPPTAGGGQVGVA